MAKFSEFKVYDGNGRFFSASVKYPIRLVTADGPPTIMDRDDYILAEFSPSMIGFWRPIVTHLNDIESEKIKVTRND